MYEFRIYENPWVVAIYARIGSELGTEYEVLESVTAEDFPRFSDVLDMLDEYALEADPNDYWHNGASVRWTSLRKISEAK